MSELISDKWIESFPTMRNADKGIAIVLGTIGFKSIIGYGFKGEEMSFSVAHISRKLQTLVGDSIAMMKYSRTSAPMSKFPVMGKA